jgi:nitroimidazol reductase NimA-like FMN-containing flavoprotein (pyridoxamine 5'-phosphate oxidase superfamily)
MQNRMKKNQLNNEQITELLIKSPVGNIATINENGYPYVVPVHFIYYEGKVYIHGLPIGQKISNIKMNEKVCFETYYLTGYILDEKPCDVNTEYESVVIMGIASIVKDYNLKESVLNKIVGKYTPNLTETKLPSNMVKGTGVIEVIIKEITGKYYK